jgi:hypothetical protein
MRFGCHDGLDSERGKRNAATTGSQPILSIVMLTVKAGIGKEKEKSQIEFTTTQPP